MNFKAYQTENDKEWNEGTNNEKYYTKIFKDSYKESFKSDNNSQYNKQFNVHVENNISPTEKDHQVEITMKLLGTITIKNKDESSIRKILERTLEEEQKYYFKYAINTDHSDQNILQELNRVTLMDFYKIFRIRDTNYGTKSNHLNKFITQFACQNLTLENQEDGKLKHLAQKVVEFMFPILIEKEKQEIWNVYLNSDAKPLYLDQGTDTAMYRYKLEGSTYKKAINFIVCNKITYVGQTNSYYVNPPGNGAVNLSLNSTQNQGPIYLNCFPRTSFFMRFIRLRSRRKLLKKITT